MTVGDGIGDTSVEDMPVSLGAGLAVPTTAAVAATVGDAAGEAVAAVIDCAAVPDGSKMHADAATTATKID